MDKILKALFEYQRFEKNERLSAMLERAENALDSSLDDEELAWVAGGSDRPSEDEDPLHH